jgi:hypothetical protein
MPTLSFNRPTVSRTIRFDGGVYTPPRQRGRSIRQTVREWAAVGSDPSFEGTAALAVQGAPAWLSVPVAVQDSVAFSIDFDASALAPGTYSAVVKATKDGFDSAALAVVLVVLPMH